MYRVGRTELQVDVVGVMDQLHGLGMTQIFADVAAHLVGKGQLAIGESACARPAVDDAAGITMNALARGAGWTGAVGDGSPGVHNKHLRFGLQLRQLQRSKNAGRAGADNDRIIDTVFHKGILLAACGRGTRIYVLLYHAERGTTRQKCGMFPEKDKEQA